MSTAFYQTLGLTVPVGLEDEAIDFLGVVAEKVDETLNATATLDVENKRLKDENDFLKEEIAELKKYRDDAERDRLKKSVEANVEASLAPFRQILIDGEMAKIQLAQQVK